MQFLIPVIDHSGKFSRVPPRELDVLIEKQRILGFKRRDGWVVVGEDPVRQPHSAHRYNGPERRQVG